MKRLLAIFLITLFSLPLGLNPAFAGKLTGGDYNMYVNPTTAGGGLGIHWPKLDENLSVAGILAVR
ncbi:MAG: DUF2442 domain-containing protein [Candidatus Margulisbacteria bacterium]|nr:DUF2442 domain-containing protein [Candidatus Margulisiibacteriota bacterium]